MSTITSEIKLRIKTEGDAALTGLGAKLNSLANQATASSQTFKGLAAELRNVQSTTVQSTNNLKAYSASWRELAGSVDIASKEFREARIEAARLDAQIAKAEGRKGRGGRIAGAAQTVGAIAASGVFGGPEGALGAGIGAIAGGPMGAAVGGAIGAQVGQLRQALGATGEYVAELSKLQIALAGVSRNSNEYEKNLSAVSRLSDQFLIPLKDTTQQYTKLQASVVGAGMETKQTETVFKGISAAILATGGTTEDLNSALRATSQVFSKGKVSAEELRQQIGERLPGAFTIFASSMGKTPEELDKALERGEVTLEDFIKFSEDLFKRYGKTAKIIAEAPQNAGARLKLALDKINQDVGRLTQPIGATFQTLGEEMLKGLSPVLKAFADLIDAPKQLAKERLPQIERQLKEANSQLIQARKFKGGLYGDSSLFGLINQKDEESILKTMKKLKGEEALLKAQIDQIGSATDDTRRQKKAEEEKAITTIKEKAIIQLRELEEKTINDLADLREKQIQRALDLERQIADQRLKVEREIQDLRQENVYAGEDFQYLEEFRKLQGLGESTAALDIGQKTRESIRAFDKERIQIQRTSEDESQQRQKTLEAFKKTNADEIGRIQLNYTRQSSNILQKAGDELKKAMKEGAQELRQSVMQSVIRFMRVELGYPAQPSDAPLTAPPAPVLPPPANLRPTNQQANSAAAGVGMQITSSMTRPIPSSQQIGQPALDRNGRIVVQPFAGVQTETQRLSESQESKNKLELQKKASKFLKEQKEQQTAILAPLQNQDKLYKEQAENRQRLNELIRGGATPALAEEYLQIEKIGTERRKGLEAFGDELKKQINLNGLTKEQLEYRENLINQNNTYILGIDEAINKTKALAAENERVKTTQAEIKQLWDGISETIGGGVGQAVDLLIKGTEDFGTSLQNIASGILKDIASQIARMLVIQPIVAGLKSLFPFANGGIMTSQGPMPLKRYAAGGIANSPQLAMYGEGRMPEAYVPLPDGRRIPVAMQGGGGATSVVVNVDAGGTSVQGNAPRGDQLGKALSAAVQAELIKQRRPGGLLA
jgi:tape measure domain-containing protein